ncbi:hypothetical protein SAMN05421759_102447 [Roseivivax lentus]|uniref:Plastocyanin n=1 Tax=Roseivivax lentus TaxID=633194 RepID=A0A1N7L7H3_9RHOB|nr:hypothetical protein [Roseivivax lentus]SIS69788.1 hypothetical protein SAMN05421759_102447 [Roseivivax lentus]
MLRATLVAAALSAAFTLPVAAIAQTAATAPEVTMLGRGYFPNKLHVGAEGTVVFHNAGFRPMAATAIDESWGTGWVFPGQRVTVVLPPEGALVYNSRLNVLSALDPLFYELPEGHHEGMIVVGDADDLVAADGSPLDEDTLFALYGAPTHDTDGDGDLDGYDWSEMLTDPEDRPWAATDGDDDGTEVSTASN